MPSANSLTESFDPLASLVDSSQSQEYTARLLRNEVREIIGSYHHAFDHLHECLQNAVDACESAFEIYAREGTGADYTPTVDVIINLPDNSLTVTDNGVGMSKSMVIHYFFTPYATLKIQDDGRDAARQRGEKGVGATFLSYGSNFVHLTTKDLETSELTSGSLIDGRKWCDGRIALMPLPQVQPTRPDPLIADAKHGTAVTIRFSADTNIVRLADHAVNCTQWEAILRLHTAVGYIDFAETDPFLRALLARVRVINPENQSESKLVETGYYYPHKTTAANVELSALAREDGGKLPARQRDMHILWDTFSYEQVSQFVTDRMQRSRYMRQTARSRISSILNIHRPEAYVGFTYSADYWEQANHALWGTELDGQFRHGIVFATKSQKIGEQVRIDFRFRSGDFNRFFVLLSMQNLRADIGRKSLPADISEFGNFFANSVQDLFVKNSDCLKPSPGPFDENQAREVEEVIDSALARASLERDWLHFTRVPTEEQDVIALFFDLLGSGHIRGYSVYATHVARTYDGVAFFQLSDAQENRYSPTNRLGIAADKFVHGEMRSPSRNIIEFKYSSDGLVKDVRSGYKQLKDIKWLVCWTIGESHTNEGIGILDVTEPAQINQRDYYGVTHIMTEGQNKVYVICLEKVLELLRTRIEH